jgi:hypothetical protein
MVRRPGPSDTIATTTRRSGADRNFHLAIALTIAAVVAVGFGPTANERLLHPPSPRPWILYVHVAVFTTWVLLFVAQAALVRFRRVAWHRRLGVFGIVLGALVPVVGVATALTMTRLRRADGETGGESFLIVSLFDMLAFAVAFGLAMQWRRRPEYHRRLLLIASCGLTSAAFARFPSWLMVDDAWYVCVDALILAGVARDWLVVRRVHPVYLYGLPAVVFGQATAMWIYRSGAPAWVAIAQTLLQ